MQGCASGLPQSWTGILGVSGSVSTSMPTFSPGGAAGRGFVTSDVVVVESAGKLKVLFGGAYKPAKGLVGTGAGCCS